VVLAVSFGELMESLGEELLLFAGCVLAYTYVGYPLLLKALTLVRRRRHVPRDEPVEWPMVTVSVPVYNEAVQAAALLESLLALDYPEGRLQIVIVSDGSTDGTDEVVRAYADQGVELIRMPVRSGKTACENAVVSALRGDIVVNTDASIRMEKDAIRRLVAAFNDPGVGLASARDVSVSRATSGGNLGESGYVDYEMWLRDLETEAHGIVGASGCLYAIRARLHAIHVPESLSRDFCAALKCEAVGYRAVTVRDAVCYVPRTTSIRKEYWRKVRTMTRGIETLVHHRALLNPLRHGSFAWMLASHKACRWMVPWALLVATLGLGLVTPSHPWAPWLLAVVLAVFLMGIAGWMFGDGRRLPRPIQLSAFFVTANLAAMHAALRALNGAREPMWEPTRRESAAPA
jgi:cellulose synthase/poly-beta-1,6-N-acetylglucosamine synthase-like glycosyltransferase